MILAVFVATASAQVATKPTLYYIPHTHWEGAVFNTREEYLQFGLDHILQALRLMEKDPNFKFTLDQVAYFKPFLERYPERAAEFRRFIKEGRLELVGGMDVMPDEVKPGAELLVRQIQYGKGYCRKALGLDVDVAWLLDTFGHTPQLPQILDEAGFKSLWYCRGTPDPNEPSEFSLKGLDGSTIESVWLPGFYGLFYYPPRKQTDFDKFFIDRWNYIGKNAPGPERVGLAGADVSEPEDWAPPMVRHFNDEPNRPFTIRYAIPTDFANLVAKRTNLPIRNYDLNPIFTGTFSSRVENRQTAKELERDLTETEQFMAIGESLGAPANMDSLWDAWEPTLFNQTHDLASGTMNDHTYFDTVRQYQVSRGIADNLRQTAWDRLATRIDTSGQGTPIVVFNPQGWARTDLATADLGFSENGVYGLRIVGPDGAAVPYQTTGVQKYGDGVLMRVKLAFVAKDVPAGGYAVYHVLPAPTVANAEPTSDSHNPTLENEFYRVTVDPKTGAITSVLDKSLKAEMLSGPANVVARQTDKGDLWTLYHPLDGSQYMPTLDQAPVPAPPAAVLSDAFSDKPGSFTRGRVFEEFTVAHPFDKGTFATTIRLVHGVRRIDIETQLVNRTPQVRYQALFPTAIADGNNVQEVAFGAIARPMGVEYPAQNWVDTTDGKRGVALLNFAMPGNVNTGGTLMLSLLRSVTEGDYNGGDNSNTGLEIGVPRTFRYALVPHAGDWRSAHLVQAGQEFASPLIACKVEAHKGALPPAWQGISFSDPDVVLSSIQPAEHGTMLVRFYESTGKAVHNASVGFGERIAWAENSDLLGDSKGRIKLQGSRVIVDLHPFEIKTLKLKMADAKP